MSCLKYTYPFITSLFFRHDIYIYDISVFSHDIYIHDISVFQTWHLHSWHQVFFQTVMSEKQWCYKCCCHVGKTRMPECRCHEKNTLMSSMYMTSTLITSAFLRIDINIDDMCISDMTSTFMICVFQTWHLLWLYECF
jgi:hypothetical protein